MIYNAYNPKILNCQIIIYYMPVTWNKTVIAGFKKILIVLIFVMLSSSFFILALNKNQNLISLTNRNTDRIHDLKLINRSRKFKFHIVDFRWVIESIKFMRKLDELAFHV
jgi:uncharacterized protein YacL